MNIVCPLCSREFDRGRLPTSLCETSGFVFAAFCPFCGCLTNFMKVRSDDPRPTLENRLPLPVGTLVRVRKDLDLAGVGVSCMLAHKGKLARITGAVTLCTNQQCSYRICKDAEEYFWSKSMFQEIIYMPYRHGEEEV